LIFPKALARGPIAHAHRPEIQIRLTKREETTLLFIGVREKGLDSSVGEKNQGNQPAEKNDVYEESFHTVFYRLMCE
jgi:hypothetical protein